MTKQTKNFLKFLANRRRANGKNVFTRLDYQNFNGHDAAIEELKKRGLVKIAGDIIGTIEIVPDRI